MKQDCREKIRLTWMVGRGVVLACFLGCFCCLSRTESGAKSVWMHRHQRFHKGTLQSLSSEQVDVRIAPNGNFTMGTVQGDPENPRDDGIPLLFGYPDGFTGFTTLRVDGIDFRNFGSRDPIGTLMEGPAQVEGANTTIWEAGGIRLTQRLSLSKGSSGLLDTLCIEYEVLNTDTVSHSVGVRMFLDTQLGNNDGAPFRIPGIGSVTRELELSGEDVPELWISFDDLVSPVVQTQGSFVGLRATRPNKVIWADWQNLGATSFEYTADPSENLTDDSAVGIYWGPEMLPAGGSMSYVTYYGLGNIEITQTDFVVGLSAPRELFLEGNEYTPNPFTITLFVGNPSGVDSNVRSMTATLTLSEGLELIPGEDPARSLGDLRPGAETQTTWHVMATGSPAGNVAYHVEVIAQNLSPASIQGEILVPDREATSPSPTPVLVPEPPPTPTATPLLPGSSVVGIHPGFESGVFAGRGLTQSSVALGDIDQDGLPEILIGGRDGGLYAFNGDGSPVLTDQAAQSLRKADLPLGATPGLLFQTPENEEGIRPPILSTPALVDVDHDSRVDVLWGTDGGEVYRLELRLSTDPENLVMRKNVRNVDGGPKIGRTRNFGHRPSSDREESDDVGSR